ncbi:melanocortin-2 receptor accessory protein isoform X1 [Moschus berezovskii]|uniref:melanocortin-2 receptor accessory protein isoform X1 n=1 Tax=Moschus berezovskii TaxID=68408 RepID=UPI0024443CC0|nr:melanocortin-2 receptor accessory protein isoform X1 [Moschus berezovskii]
MANKTNTSAPYYSYEYYLDYLDLMPVDEKKLRANKHSIVIAFWVSLAAFVVFLFLILLYMSWSGSPQTRNNATQWPPTCPWSLGLNLQLCIWRQPQHPRAPQGDPAASTELGRGTRRRDIPACPAAATAEPLHLGSPRTTLLSSGNRPSVGTHRVPADVSNTPSERPLQTEPLDGRTNTPNPRAL